MSVATHGTAGKGEALPSVLHSVVHDRVLLPHTHTHTHRRDAYNIRLLNKDEDDLDTLGDLINWIFNGMNQFESELFVNAEERPFHHAVVRKCAAANPSISLVATIRLSPSLFQHLMQHTITKEGQQDGPHGLFGSHGVVGQCDSCNSIFPSEYRPDASHPLFLNMRAYELEGRCEMYIGMSLNEDQAESGDLKDFGYDPLKEKHVGLALQWQLLDEMDQFFIQTSQSWRAPSMFMQIISPNNTKNAFAPSSAAASPIPRGVVFHIIECGIHPSYVGKRIPTSNLDKLFEVAEMNNFKQIVTSCLHPSSYFLLRHYGGFTPIKVVDHRSWTIPADTPYPCLQKFREQVLYGDASQLNEMDDSAKKIATLMPHPLAHINPELEYTSVLMLKYIGGRRNAKKLKNTRPPIINLRAAL